VIFLREVLPVARILADDRPSQFEMEQPSAHNSYVI